MRMWMIDPKFLCRKHLLGEHGEIHKHKHNFVKKHNITGRIVPNVQIEPLSMLNRHDSLVKEMLQRGYNHNSIYEMPDVSYLPIELRTAKVDIEKSIDDLSERCVECRNNLIGKN